MKHNWLDDDVPANVKHKSQTPKTTQKHTLGVVTPTEWRLRYLAYMLAQGLSEDDAQYYYDGIEFGTHAAVYDCSDDPEDAAEEDLTYG